jgi:hypothetical protein
MSQTLAIISTWIAYGGLNVLIAKMNSNTVASRIKAKDTRQINHPLWAGIYAVLCVPTFLFIHSWLFVGAVVLLHLSVFPVAFNRYRGNPAFYLSTTTTSFTDRIMDDMGFKSTEAVNILAFAGSILLTVLTIMK